MGMAHADSGRAGREAIAAAFVAGPGHLVGKVRVEVVVAGVAEEDLGAVKSVLASLGIEEFMEGLLLCHGRQPERHAHRPGMAPRKNVTPMTRLEIVADKELAEELVEAVGSVAGTGRAGQWRIFVLPFFEAR